jgi:hypothetical protein
MEFEGGVRPPTKTSEHNVVQQKKPRTTTPVQAASSEAVASGEVDDGHIQMRMKILEGTVTLSHHHSTAILFTHLSEGLPHGQIVEVNNVKNSDRWYMKIVDGRVKGPEDAKVGPFLVGAQWFKANSRSALESHAVVQCPIKTIIGICASK